MFILVINLTEIFVHIRLFINTFFSQTVCELTIFCSSEYKLTFKWPWPRPSRSNPMSPCDHRWWPQKICLSTSRWAACRNERGSLMKSAVPKNILLFINYLIFPSAFKGQISTTGLLTSDSFIWVFPPRPRVFVFPQITARTDFSVMCF